MRRFSLFACFMLLFSLFCGCAPNEADFFSAFSAGYTAEVEGALYGLAVSAKIEMGAVRDEGTVPATVIFYAPAELAGTILTRDEAGQVTVNSGGLAAGDSGGIGAALFSLFPTTGAVSGTTVSEEGHTVLLSEGTTLTFLQDGTPYMVQNDALSLTVVSFSKK